MPCGTQHGLHVKSARCVACDLHTIAPRSLERTCWRQFAAQREDCKKSWTVPLNAITIIIIIIILQVIPNLSCNFTSASQNCIGSTLSTCLSLCSITAVITVTMCSFNISTSYDSTLNHELVIFQNWNQCTKARETCLIFCLLHENLIF